MAEIISGDSTYVHTDLAIHFGLENLLLFAHRVVQPQLRRLRRARRTETSAPAKAALPGPVLEAEGIQVVSESNRP